MKGKEIFPEDNEGNEGSADPPHPRASSSIHIFALFVAFCKKNRGSWAKGLVLGEECTRISNEEWILRTYLSALRLKYIGTKDQDFSSPSTNCAWKKN